jgi:hypothetical protein
MKNTNKLGHYLALTLGAGAAVTSAEGATTVTVYGQGVTPPAGINPALSSTGGLLDNLTGFGSLSFFANSAGELGMYKLFTSGDDLGAVLVSSPQGPFGELGTMYSYGAQLGNANYANISLNGDDWVFEAVGQFHIGVSGIWLIALAKNSDNSALSISAGKAEINAGSGSGGTSPVPEVSSHLALLALMNSRE